MAIRLIAEQERLEAVVEGSTFYYKRLPAHVRAKIIDDNTSKRSGNTNWNKVSIAILRHCILDWKEKDVVDGNGNPIPFDPDLLAYLPDTVQGALLDLVGENASPDEASLKNSKPSQSSST